ncbi:MAG: (2Fe-2S) ferredoxin domain-containing protein [Spirulinaceae cyanobacterium RM2_2_10]|nr:(2Fe-2S) ferredoxin domain-containing protein [Spirulinaceae cyanobacterium SM2_1_0]NJO20782.1 (2Fe-2S) ferredoxin domain-containing protein [Spirulinaceae cyanobacterium RM2_2_10]
MTDEKRTVLVCQSSSCLERGGTALLAAFQAADLPADVEVQATTCLGQCNMASNVRILPEETWYCRLQPEDAERVVEEHLKKGDRLTDKLHPRIHSSYRLY